MKRFILFLLLGILLASCAEQKSTPGEYIASQSNLEQVVHIDRNADNGNRIEWFQISISDGGEVNGNIEYNGEEPIRIYGTASYSGLSQEFSIEGKDFILEIIYALEYEQYVPISVDINAKVYPNGFFDYEYTATKDGITQKVSVRRDPYTKVPLTFTIIMEGDNTTNIQGVIVYNGVRQVYGLEEINLYYRGSIRGSVHINDTETMVKIENALVYRKFVPLPLPN